MRNKLLQLILLLLLPASTFASEELRESLLSKLGPWIGQYTYEAMQVQRGAQPPSDRFKKVRLTEGNAGMLDSVSAGTPMNITISNGVYTVGWVLPDQKVVSLRFPLDIYVVSGEDRTALENTFARNLRPLPDAKHSPTTIIVDDLEPLGEDLFIIPGASYRYPEINQDRYYELDTTAVWAEELPLESMANLFAGIVRDVPMTLRILKHEYGEQDTVRTTLHTLLDLCRSRGTSAYWACDKFEDGVLDGVLVFVNNTFQFNHIIRVSLVPEEIIKGNGEILARASLFIPVNNIEDIFKTHDPNRTPRRRKVETP